MEWAASGAGGERFLCDFFEIFKKLNGHTWAHALFNNWNESGVAVAIWRSSNLFPSTIGSTNGCWSLNNTGRRGGICNTSAWDRNHRMHIGARDGARQVNEGWSGGGTNLVIDLKHGQCHFFRNGGDASLPLRKATRNKLHCPETRNKHAKCWMRNCSSECNFSISPKSQLSYRSTPNLHLPAIDRLTNPSKSMGVHTISKFLCKPSNKQAFRHKLASKTSLRWRVDSLHPSQSWEPRSNYPDPWLPHCRRNKLGDWGHHPRIDKFLRGTKKWVLKNRFK